MTRFIACILAFLVPATTALAVTTPAPSAVSPKYLYRLSYEDVEGAVGFALSQKGAGEKVTASIPGDRSNGLFTYNKPVSVEIHGLQYEESGAKFSANLLFRQGEDVVSAMPISGRYEALVELPVLKRQVRGDDVIRADDIEIRDFPVTRTKQDMVTDMASLLGKSAVHSISPNRPVREAELTSPSIIKKNAMVEMRYISPGMQIMASGQALDEGGKGSIISVRNTTSKKVIRAQVEDANTVTILPTNLQASDTVAGRKYETN